MIRQANNALPTDRNFNAAGIDMAFPQRDVHLDAQDPLPIRIVGEKAGS